MRRLLLLVACLGCGGAPAPKPKAAPEDPLTAELARRASAPRGAQAVVTLAVFHPGDPAPASALVNAVQDAFRDPPEAWKPVARQIGVRPELSLVALPIDADLPLDVEALKASAGDQRAAADAAHSVRFVRYVGPPGADGQHLLAVALATQAVADGAPIVDLATRAWWSPASFEAAVLDPRWVHDQVLPVGEPTGPDTVRFFTLGMAKLGLPDVELDAVPKAEARERFEAFQRFTFALRAHGYAEPGDEVAGLKLRPCVRDAAQYDHKCVRIPTPTP